MTLPFETSSARAPADGQRRAALRHALCIAVSLTALGTTGCASADRAAPLATPPIRFLEPADGRAALGEGAARDYYEALNLREIRARLGQPLDGVPVADARIRLHEFYASQVLAFSDEEMRAIREIIERMQPLLAQRAPLYARTPWSFIKIADAAEGGAPHTRGAHIVLPVHFVEDIAAQDRRLRAAGTLASATFWSNLLVHEQTHVLQRADPARFESLYTQVLGFTRARPAPASAWLDEHVLHNPDALDLGWVFDLEPLGGSGWIWPQATLADLAVPRMFKDLAAVGIAVAPQASGWRVLEDDGRPRLRKLDDIAGYHAAFPWEHEDFHPNEIAAVLLQHWILQDEPGIAARPRMAEAIAWARRGLA